MRTIRSARSMPRSQMQRELRAETQRRAAKGLQSLEARVGVHTGEVVAYSVETGGKVEYRLVGHTANLASRLEALAPVGFDCGQRLHAQALRGLLRDARPWDRQRSRGSARRSKFMR